MAAQGATDKIVALTDDDELSEKLEQMQEEARETRSGAQSCGSLDGKKTAVLDKARETKAEATEMMSTYPGDDADALDGFEFLTMAEAGEVGHWSVLLGKLNEQAGDQRLPAADRVGAPDSGAALRRREGRLPQAGGTGGSGRGRLAGSRRSSLTSVPPSRRAPWAGGPRRQQGHPLAPAAGDQTSPRPKACAHLSALARGGGASDRVRRRSDQSRSTPAHAAKQSPPIVPATVISTPAAAAAATPVAAENQHGCCGADTGTDRQLAERHDRNQYRDCIEEGGVHTDGVEQQPVAEDLRRVTTTTATVSPTSRTSAKADSWR